MDGVSLSNAYAQMKFGFDIAAEYLAKPLIILVCIAILLGVWRVLTPDK